MTRVEYEKLVDEVLTAERDRLAESLNAVFEQKGRNPEVLVQVIAQAVESQPAVAARVVTELLDGLGLLPGVPETSDGAS